MFHSDEKPDYSLENVLPDDYAGNDKVNINATVILEVKPSDVHCVKGDCAGDYPCWPICGLQ